MNYFKKSDRLSENPAPFIYYSKSRKETVCAELSDEYSMLVGWLCWGLTSQSTIFQSCRDGAIASWVIYQYFRGVKCLAQGHNTAAVGFEPRTSRSGVRHSTTEPPRSPEYSMQCTPPKYLLRQKCLRKDHFIRCSSLEWHLWHPLKVTPQSDEMPDTTVLRAARTSSINNLKTIPEVGNNLTYPGFFVSPSNTYD